MERIEWNRHEHIPGVEILTAENSQTHWRGFHENYIISALLECEGTEWTYRGRLHSATAGDMALMQPGEMHVTKKIVRPQSFRAIFFTPAVVEKAAIELGAPPGKPAWRFPKIRHPALFEILLRMHRTLQGKSTTLEREWHLSRALRALLQHCSERGTKMMSPKTAVRKSRLERARALIHERYALRITLAELEAETGLSRYHLDRTFAAEFGLPPHAYQIQIRLAQVRQKVVAGMLLRDIAAETGFADQAHMSRHFKRAFGVTPGVYRSAGLTR